MPIFPEKLVFPIGTLQDQLGVENRKQYIVSKKLLEIFTKKVTSVKHFSFPHIWLVRVEGQDVREKTLRTNESTRAQSLIVRLNNLLSRRY